MNKIFILLLISVICIHQVHAEFDEYTIVKNSFQPDNSTEIITVFAKFTNLFGSDIIFDRCEIMGQQTEPIKDILAVNDTQNFVFESYRLINVLSGNCYYNITLSDSSVEVLDILLYFNRKFGSEWYGMSNSELNSYGVCICIPASANALYYIMEYDNDNHNLCLRLCFF
ncbi:MAG: hypothetical protein Terrestrivirus5_55 [Terrestrivirus sp.]|uniref:Uncharacterized protein n=1 Tax=Terrestrivirus sp. TaxID=2487775 RepID=A0A3G4ZRL1_9VIRU|nr:MAG: hypothetical protein Terrestrivirus5_55 [Terrestrivirus sp.]